MTKRSNRRWWWRRASTSDCGEVARQHGVIHDQKEATMVMVEHASDVRETTRCSLASEHTSNEFLRRHMNELASRLRVTADAAQ